MSARASILNRLYVVLLLTLLLPAGVLAQMVRIHLGEGAELREQGESQSSSRVELAAQRGAIYDRAGRALVVNTARYQVALDPTVRGFEAKADELYRVLSEVTHRSAAYYRQRVANRASRQYVVLERNLDEEDKEMLEAEGIPGLLIEGEFARRYVYGQTGAHVLGYVNSDLEGLAGLEKHYDEMLSGTPGEQAVQRDRRGNVKAIVGGSRTEPRNGENLVLTVDLVRQAILEEELARGVAASGAAWGAAIAMDPRTGAVLAMANVPTFDPNHPGDFSDAERRNHAVTDQIEPGSTFKLVTAIAALESGAVSLEDSIDTGDGWVMIHGAEFTDSHAYRRITVGEAITKSSNVAMAMTAERMGKAPLYRAARALGFGQPTTIDLPGEAAGLLHDPERWGATTLPSISIGYGVSVTPLQILTAYAALANGGLLVRPYLVAERRDARGRTLWRASRDSIRRAFDAEIAEQLLPYFENVVSRDGTAERAAVEGLRVAGKTGTARTAEGGRYVRRYRSSFVGMFPVDDPEVVLIVVMDAPRNGYYGGTVSAPVFGQVARRWIGTFPTIAQRVAPVAPFPKRARAVVPRVDGLPSRLAASRLRAEGFAVRADESWRPVRGVDDMPTDSARLDRTLTLDTAPSAAPPRMPDLRGLSARQAVAWLRSLGVTPRLSGRGVVRQQHPAAGAALTTRAALTLTPEAP